MSDKPLLDISDVEWEIIRLILQRHVPYREVWAFGSRAKWTAKEYSDLDLTILGEAPLGLALSAALAEDFSDSNLPWKVDVVDWATTSELFRKIIERDKVVVQHGNARGYEGRGISSEFQKTVLGKLVNFSNGKSSPDRFDDGKYPVFGSNGLIGMANETNAPPRSIVIGRVGSYCGSVHFSQQPCWVTDNAIKATAKEENNPEFLFYLLKHLNLNNWRSGSGQPLINQATLNAIKVRAPEPEAQRQIGQFMAALDDRIALLRETNATLEAIAQALFKSWFVDFDPVRAKMEGRAPQGMDEATAALFPDGFEESELGLVPKGWQVGRLDDCCSRIESGGTPKRTTPNYWGGDISWLTSGEVRNSIVIDTNEKITTLGVKESSAKLWPTGTTVVAMYGATAGEACLLAQPTTANQACCGLIPRVDYRAFLFFCVRRERESLASKSSGSAQQNLNKGLVSGHQVLLPSEAAVVAYENVVGALLNSWIENEKQAQTLATLRDTLLPRLISGQLRLPEAQAAAEDALT